MLQKILLELKENNETVFTSIKLLSACQVPNWKFE